MNNKKIYNDLMSELKIEKKTKKTLFLEKIDEVVKLLQSGKSLKKQAIDYSNIVEEISYSTYQNYCQQFLPEEYKESIIHTLFIKNIEHIAFYIVNSTIKTKKASNLYTVLFEKGALKIARSKEESSISFEAFSDKLKSFLEKKKYSDLIEFDVLN